MSAQDRESRMFFQKKKICARRNSRLQKHGLPGGRGVWGVTLWKGGRGWRARQVWEGGLWSSLEEEEGGGVVTIEDEEEDEDEEKEKEWVEAGGGGGVTLW